MNKNEIISNLLSTGEDQKKLLGEARQKRDLIFGNRAVLRGVIELTNICKVNCDYCPMRRDNAKNNELFFLDDEKLIMDSVSEMKKNGINVVFFQGGETHRTTKLVGKLIPKIKKLYNNDVEILLNLGIKSYEDFEYLYKQGATSYILKHETSDEVLHEKLRHESLQDRIEAIKNLLSIGYKVGTGMILGLPGQTIESIADDILLAKELGVHMCSVSPFIPAPNTPLADHSNGSSDMAVNAIAIMRILSPEWLIPSVSALEKTMSGGQEGGFNAGANVMTVNYTPTIQSEKYLIYGKDRFVVRTEHANKTLLASGLINRKSFFVK